MSISRRWPKQPKLDPITNTFLNRDRSTNPTMTSFVNRVIVICSNHQRRSIFHYSSNWDHQKVGSLRVFLFGCLELLRETTPPAECKLLGILKKLKIKQDIWKQQQDLHSDFESRRTWVSGAWCLLQLCLSTLCPLLQWFPLTAERGGRPL